MRSLVLIAALTLANPMLALAQSAERPEWLRRPVTIREARPAEVLTIIQRIGEFTLTISDDDREAIPDDVDMTFTRASIGDVLDFVLGTARLSYTIADGRVVQVFKPAKL